MRVGSSSNVAIGDRNATNWSARAAPPGRSLSPDLKRARLAARTIALVVLPAPRDLAVGMATIE
jgi:hypothetical protein